MNEEITGSSEATLEDKACVVCKEIDQFVRARPYLVALGAFAAGVALAQSCKKCHPTSRFEALGETLEELKNALGSIRNEVRGSADRASGLVSSVIGNAVKSAKRFS